MGSVLPIVTSASALPDVVDFTSGVDLAPIQEGRAIPPLEAETRKSLPITLLLYGYGGVGETLTIAGPLHLLVGRAERWYSAGLLQAGATVFQISPTRQYIGRVELGADWERAAIVGTGGGAVTGGTVTFELVTEAVL